jgi:hypothetical protein
MVHAFYSHDVVEVKASSTASVLVGREPFELFWAQSPVSIMNIAVITQPDSAVIPENISKLAAVPGMILKSIIILDVKSALANKRSCFLRGFAVWQCCGLFVRLMAQRVSAGVRRIARLGVRPGEGLSARQVAAHLGILRVSRAAPRRPRDTSDVAPRRRRSTGSWRSISRTGLSGAIKPSGPCRATSRMNSAAISSAAFSASDSAASSVRAAAYDSSWLKSSHYAVGEVTERPRRFRQVADARK